MMRWNKSFPDIERLGNYFEKCFFSELRGSGTRKPEALIGTTVGIKMTNVSSGQVTNTGITIVCLDDNPVKNGCHRTNPKHIQPTNL